MFCKPRGGICASLAGNARKAILEAGLRQPSDLWPFEQGT
jgi:hypothetical protein